VITFDNVQKQYPDGTVAVDGLSLEVPTGTLTVLVGPSGCGKTTSLRMINRMVDPTAGRVLVNGEDVRSQDPQTLRRGIGYVIQHAGLFPHRTVVDNVATVPRLMGASRKQARATAMEVLHRVGLGDELARRYPAQLSGGQQQRVGVARALAADPPILLMDEPFSAVDPVVRKELQQELLRLQSVLAKTIVLVTHDIDEAITLGDRVAVLRPGGVLAQYATPEELLGDPADDFVAGFLGVDRGFGCCRSFPRPVCRCTQTGSRPPETCRFGMATAGGCSSSTTGNDRSAGAIRMPPIPPAPSCRRDGDSCRGRTLCAPRWTLRCCRPAVSQLRSTRTGGRWAS